MEARWVCTFTWFTKTMNKQARYDEAIVLLSKIQVNISDKELIKEIDDFIYDRYKR